MKWNVTDLVTVIKYKNGRVKVLFDKKDVNKDANIYKILRELGFGYTKLDGKQIVFHRDINNKPSLIRQWQLNDTFVHFLKSYDFIGFSDDIDRMALLNCYYQYLPIKLNGLLKHYLDDKLSEFEENFFREKLPEYKYHNEY